MVFGGGTLVWGGQLLVGIVGVVGGHDGDQVRVVSLPGSHVCICGSAFGSRSRGGIRCSGAIGGILFLFG